VDAAIKVAEQSAAEQRRAEEQRAREEREAPRRAYVLSQVKITKAGLRCPDCGKRARNWYLLELNHGWSQTWWPPTAGCRAQLRERTRDFPPFAASRDAAGCGPLVEPWTTAKRFYVMEEFLYHRDRLLPWSRKWAPVMAPRQGTP